MFRPSVWMSASLLLICCALPLLAQQPAAIASTSSTVVVPPLVNFSGVLTDVNGKPLTGVVGVTFALYKDSQGGSPLWLETQNVYPDKTGHYTVMLGSTRSTGIPSQLFVGGEARWLGAQPQGQPEQARVLLLSVPYALKAADAQTVGGLPASAFVLAAPPTLGTGNSTQPAPATAAAAHGVSAAAKCASLTSDGTAEVGYLAKFTTACNLQSSEISESSGRVGIGGAYSLGKLFVTDSQTNFGTKWLHRGVFATSATTNGTNYGLGFDVDATNMTIPAGITDSGYRIALRGSSFAGNANFAGTLANQYGVMGQTGLVLRPHE